MSDPSTVEMPLRDAPRLSVLLATRHPWPTVRPSLDRLYEDARGVDAEIVVAVGDPGAKPDDAATRYPGVAWVSAPGASVFALRALALRHAQGDVVAITEDHAIVVPGWCERIVVAHADHPEAAGVGGAVVNGATETAIDWASFFIANGPFAPPLSGRGARISLQANVSYKRAMLCHASPMGMIQHTLNEDLAATGATLIADESLVVVHEQALSWREHSAGHFHNGRSIAASRLSRLGRLRALYAVAALGLPPVMLARTLRAVLPKRRYRRVLVASLPAMCWLLLCHAAGEVAGYATGPGRSPERVA